MRRTALAGAVLLAAILAPSPRVWAQGPHPDLERLVGVFERIVFGSEIAGAAPAERVRKWQGEVRFKLGGSGANAAREAVHRHAAQLSTLTGLAYREIGAKAQGETLVILVVPRAQMFETGKLVEKNETVLRRIVEDARGHCYFLSYSKADQIVYAAVVANAELDAAALAACLLEEMAQVLGLPNDDPGLKVPVAGRAPVPGGSGLTPAAELMVRALYDARLKPGMARAEARAAARQAIQDLLK